MRNLKRVLSLALALVMMLGMMIITTSAAEAQVDFADADEITNTEAVDVMVALGVIEGDGTNFNPTDILTREQAAKIICYMLIGPDNAEKLSKDTSIFADVESGRWSAGYIAYCANLGIIAGYGDGNFGPEDELTAVAFGKLLLVALGYDAEIEGYVGSNWATSIATDMIEAGIDVKGVALDAPLSRDSACQMAFQTLTADMVKYTGGVNVSTSDGTQVTVDAVRSNVTAPGYSYLNDGVGNETVTAYTQFCEKYFPTLKLAEGQTDDYGYATQVWFTGGNKDDATLTDTKTITTEVTAKVLATYTTKVGNITKGNLYTLTGLTTAIPVYENGNNASSSVTPAKGDSTKPFSGYTGATVAVVDNDNDGAADAILVSYAYIAEVTKVTAATATADRSVTLKVYNQADGTATTSVTYTTEDFAKGDYVLVYIDGTVATTQAYTTASAITGAGILDVKAAEVVDGKVTNIGGTNGSGVNALTMDGVKYSVAADAFATMGLNSSTLVKASSYGFTSPYTLVLSNGYVVGAVGENVATNIENIVYVTKASYQSTNEYGEDAYMVETVALDGTVEIVKNYGWYNSSTSTRVPAGTVYASATSAPAAIAAGFYTKQYDGATKTYKFTVASGYASIDNSTVYYGTTTLSSAVAMTADTTSVALTGATKGYITDATRLIFVNGSGSSLSVSLVTGAMKQSIANGSQVLLSQDANGNYEVEAIIIGAKQVSVASEVVYIDNTATGTNANGTEYAMYDIATGEKTTITAAASLAVNGFATYSVNDKGVYSFNAVANPNSDNADGIHVLTAAVTRYGTLLSEDDDTDCNLVDIEAADAVILNLTTASGTKGLSLTLSDIASASSLTATAYVVDEAVVSIVVTAITLAP